MARRVQLSSDGLLGPLDKPAIIVMALHDEDGDDEMPRGLLVHEVEAEITGFIEVEKEHAALSPMAEEMVNMKCFMNSVFPPRF